MELATHEYNDFMLDLETLGTRPGDAIISIGGVLFNRDTKDIGPGFRANLDIEQVLGSGFQCTGGTLAWWFRQSDAARQQALARPQNIASVLMGLAEFLTEGEGGVNKSMRVWGNGAAFDNVLLREMYQRLGFREPWEFWNDRCFRTLKAEHPRAKELEPDFEGERHNAYADALHQAKWAINLHHNFRVFSVVEPGVESPHDNPDEDPMATRELGSDEEESE